MAPQLYEGSGLPWHQYPGTREEDWELIGFDHTADIVPYGSPIEKPGSTVALESGVSLYSGYGTKLAVKDGILFLNTLLTFTSTTSSRVVLRLPDWATTTTTTIPCAHIGASDSTAAQVTNYGAIEAVAASGQTLQRCFLAVTTPIKVVYKDFYSSYKWRRKG
ncbi:MAG: hypothetical protein FWE51_01495 [Coriobacteriia bacterium]|nr:hypothetical protein [Coriobacteriia bacterium]